MNMRSKLDRAGADVLNALSIGNPEHEPIETLGLGESQPRARRERDPIEQLGLYTCQFFAGIEVIAVAADALTEIPDKLAKSGVGMGLGGVAIGAGVYLYGRATKNG
jgi:hypothetical protein